MTTMQIDTTDTTTSNLRIHVSATEGTPSKYVDDSNARDYKVTLTIAGVRVDGSATLIPREYDGELDAWGDLDNWLSASLVPAVCALGDADRRELLREIVATCQMQIGDGYTEVASTRELQRLVSATAVSS